ncbi:Protein argonaute 11 [Hordeum vulgare]|nr:Protein argonaute 11 [Hordeum vulgare]
MMSTVFCPRSSIEEQETEIEAEGIGGGMRGRGRRSRGPTTHLVLRAGFGGGVLRGGGLGGLVVLAVLREGERGVRAGDALAPALSSSVAAAGFSAGGAAGPLHGRRCPRSSIEEQETEIEAEGIGGGMRGRGRRSRGPAAHLVLRTGFGGGVLCGGGLGGLVVLAVLVEIPRSPATPDAPAPSEDVLLRVPQRSHPLAAGDLCLHRIQAGDTSLAAIAALGAVQWPLARDVAAVKLDPRHYSFSFAVPASPDDPAPDPLHYGLTLSVPTRASTPCSAPTPDISATAFYKAQEVMDFAFEYLNIHDASRPLIDRHRIKIVNRNNYGNDEHSKEFGMKVTNLLALVDARVLPAPRDQIPPFPTRNAIRTIESELGSRMSDLFADICPEPIAATSLGQVYKAYISDMCSPN